MWVIGKGIEWQGRNSARPWQTSHRNAFHTIPHRNHLRPQVISRYRWRPRHPSRSHWRRLRRAAASRRTRDVLPCVASAWPATVRSVRPSAVRGRSVDAGFRLQLLSLFTTLKQENIVFGLSASGASFLRAGWVPTIFFLQCGYRGVGPE